MRVVQVVADGEIGIVQAGVGEGQYARRPAPGEEALQLQPVAAAKEVALHDGGGDAHAVVAGVAHAAHDGAGIGFLDLDLEINFVFVFRGDQFHIHGREEVQTVQALVGAAQLGPFVHVAVAQAHFAQDDVVAGFGIALDRQTADEDLLLFVDHIAHVHLIAAVIGLDDLGVHFGESITVIGIVVGQAFGVFLHDREGEVLVGFFPVVHLHDFKHLVFAVDNIASKDHVAHGVAGAFVHVECDVDAVVAVFNGWRSHLNIYVAFVKAKGGNGVGVALQVFVLEHAGTRQPRENAACLEGHVFVKIAAIELVEAFNLDVSDIKLVAFGNADHQHCAAPTLTVFKTVGDLGKVKAFLVVQFADFLEVVRKHLFVQNTAALGAHGRKHVVLADLVRTVNNDVVDARLFNHGEHKHVAFKGGLHIAEVAHIPYALHFFVDGGCVRAVALADGEAHEHGIGVKHLHAAYLHIGKSAVGRGGGVHGNKGRRRIALLGRGLGGGGGIGNFCRAFGQHSGALVQRGQRVTLKSGGDGFALIDRHNARVHGKALTKLIELAVNDHARSGLAAKFAGGGKINGFTAVALQNAGGFHGNSAHAVLLELIGNRLRHILRGVGHFRPGVHLKGQNKHKGPFCRYGSTRKRQGGAGQHGKAQGFAQYVIQKSFHTMSPLSVPGFCPCLRPALGCALQQRGSCPIHG